MISKSFIVVLFVFLFMSPSSFADHNTINQQHEMVWVHLNKQVLLNGSLLKYKVYLINEINQAPSNIVYFEISDINNQPVLQWKSTLMGNQLIGSYKIPDNLAPGIYTLKIFTNAARVHATTNCFEAPILIQTIHEDPLTQATIINPGPTKNNPQLINAENLIQITLLQDSLTGKNTINLDVKKNDAPNEIAVSVSEISPFDSLFTNSGFTIAKKEQAPSQTQNITEHQFTIVTGQIHDNKRTPLKNQTIYASTAGLNVNFLYTQTDEQGRFCFALDSTFNNRQILLQLEPVQISGDSVVWNIDNKHPDLPVTDTCNQKLDADQIKYLYNLQKRELIHRIFSPEKETIQTNAPTKSAFSFYYNPSYTIFPDEYESLNNFKEIADNILPAVRFRMVDNHYQIGLVLEQQQVIYDQVLVCVNGHPFFDRDALVKFSSKNIERIEVFNATTFYGEKTFHGIIAIFTKNPEQEIHDLLNAHYIFQNKFYQNSYKTNNSSYEENPLVLPDIYWNPKIKLTPDTSLQLVFPPIDIGKYYRLKISGIYKNKPFLMEQTLQLK